MKGTWKTCPLLQMAFKSCRVTQPAELASHKQNFNFNAVQEHVHRIHHDFWPQKGCHLFCLRNQGYCLPHIHKESTCKIDPSLWDGHPPPFRHPAERVPSFSLR